MLDGSQWPTLEAWRAQSFLSFFYKFLAEAVTIEEQKLTETIRASHNLQYTVKPVLVATSIKQAISVY